MGTRLAVVFVLLLCLGAGAYAQDQTLGIGARGGVNFATQSGGTGDGWTSSGLTTFGAGLLVEYWFHPDFAAELDILYNMKGAGYKYEYPGGVFEETDEIGYISVPIMARYVILKQEAFQLYLMAGPEVSFLMSAEWEDKATGVKTDFKDDLESMEWSVDFGAGVAFPVSTFKIIGDVRYGLGLTGIHKEGDETVTNNVLYVNLGIVFPIN